MKFDKSPKSKLFQAASELFYKKGYHSVGVDSIAEKAGVGKMTLYRHFPSKDQLILSFLEESDKDFWQYFESSFTNSESPREKLIAFFTALQRYVTGPACYGCPFINIASEYPESEYAGHQLASKHKLMVRTRFLELSRQAKARNPETLANGLLLLMDGAYIAARMYGNSSENPATNVADAASYLIDAAISDK